MKRRKFIKRTMTVRQINRAIDSSIMKRYIGNNSFSAAMPEVKITIIEDE